MSSTRNLRILFVDDDVVAQLACHARLAHAGHSVTAVGSSAEARTILANRGTTGFDAVLTDYNMPGEDGLSLLNFIVSQDACLSVIIMTALGEKELVTRSLREGAHNFLEKPFEQDVLLEAVESAGRETAAKRLLRADANAARAVADTQHLLLGRMTAALSQRLHLFFRPREGAGGDFAAVFNLSEHSFVLLLTDISGHDLRAAFHAAYFQGLARGLLQQGASLTEVFRHLNQTLLTEWNTEDRVELSLSACAVCVDTMAGVVEILNCGLPAPRFSQADHFVCDIGRPAAPLGWFEELPEPLTYELNGGSLQLWSDGLDDMADKLDICPLALSHRLRHDPEGGRQLLQDAPDDVIVAQLNLGRQPAQLTAHPVFHAEFRPQDAGRIDSILSRLERSLRTALPDLSDEQSVQTVLCARESLLNALTHGCGASGGTCASLTVHHCPGSACLQLVVRDDGDGHAFDVERHEQAAAAQLLTEHRGLIMLRHLARNLTLARNGAHVSMEIPLAQAS